jgi:hypothetical protein
MYINICVISLVLAFVGAVSGVVERIEMEPIFQNIAQELITCVSADDSKVLSMADGVQSASYRVVKAGDNNPVDTSRQLVVDPTDKTASPNGWHVQGDKKFTATIDNNVIAQVNYEVLIIMRIYLIRMVARI